MEPTCDDCGERISRCTCNGRDPGPDPADDQSNMKIAINNVLWSRLPGGTTLDEAESIAIDLLVAVEGELERREAATRPPSL